MPIKIDSSDFDRRVKELLDRGRFNIKRAVLNTLADDTVTRAFEVCPADKKNLRTTIRKEEVPGMEDQVIKVVAGGMWGRGNPPVYVDYAIYVHEGTSKMVGRPFLTQGATQALYDTDDSKYRAAAFD